MDDADQKPELEFHGESGWIVFATVIGVVVGLAMAVGVFALLYPTLFGLWGDETKGIALSVATLVALLFIPFIIGWRVSPRIHKWGRTFNAGGRVVLYGKQLVCTGPRDKWEHVFNTSQQFEAELVLVIVDAMEHSNLEGQRVTPRMSMVILEQNMKAVSLLIGDKLMKEGEIPITGPIAIRETDDIDTHPQEIQLDRVEIQTLLDKLNYIPKKRW